jgi:hypothetical protein
MVFKRTWGEQVVGNFGLGWAIFLMFLGWTAVSGLVLYVSANILPVAMIPAIGVAVLGYVLLGLFGSALSGVYTAALYRYAMTGEVANFDPSIMGNAFRPK